MSLRRPAEQLRLDALAIWQAGVEAVASERLVADNVRVEDDTLQIVDDELPLRDIRRIVVVGAGKAGAGMAAGLEGRVGRPTDGRQAVAGMGQRAGRLRASAAPHHTARRPAGRPERTHAGRRRRLSRDPGPGRTADPRGSVPVPAVRRRVSLAPGAGRRALPCTTSWRSHGISAVPGRISSSSIRSASNSVASKGADWPVRAVPVA